MGFLAGRIQRRASLAGVAVLAAALLVPASGGARTSGMPSTMHMEMPSRAARVPYASVLRAHRWTVTASSTAAGHAPGSVLDTRGTAFWRSARLGRQARLPQTLTVSFARPTVVSGLTYLPHGRRDVIGRFTVRLSRDGHHFGGPVAYGRWQANANVKRVGWVPRDIRALRVTVLSVSAPAGHAVAVQRLELAGRLRGQVTGPRTTRATGAHDDAIPRASTSATSTNPSVVGEWGPTIGFPLVPVTAALLPGDRLLVFSADSDTNYNSSNDDQYTQTAILNLATGQVSASTVSNTAHDMFCTGVSILANGDIMVTGGIGNTNTSIFDPSTNTWQTGPPMNIGRGYQGQTTLSDGQAFVLGGSWSGGEGGKLGEVFSPAGNWRELTDVPATPIDTDDSEGIFRQDNHGWFIASSGGRVFQAGPSAEMHWITTTGAGSITDAGPRGTAGDQMNGDAVLYDVNKILTVGGAPDYDNSDATNVADVVNINSSTPAVTPTASMTYARSFANSVVLPSGQVFTVGGQTYAVPFSDNDSDLVPEMWSPASGQWTSMAQEAEPRNYHSEAVLLPDGTVFSGGGGLCGTCATNHPDGQIFSPPYLFNADGSPATRPVISSAPTAAVTGQTISVTTNSSVKSFVLVRYGEATHTVDNDQRRIPLSIVSSTGDTYQLSIPSDPGIALPGPYMLFAMNAQGTPSVSTTVDITSPPVSGYGERVLADGPALYWPLSDPSGSADATDLTGNHDVGTFPATGITHQTASPVEASTGSGVTLSGGQLISTEPVQAPTSYSEELWFKTTSTTGGALATFAETSNNNGQDRIIYMTAGGHLDFGVWPGHTVTIQSPAAYNDGHWHFVVATQSSDGMHLYVDGQAVASGTTTTHATYLANWDLGGVANNWPGSTTSAFSGSLSDAAWFGTELTPAQIQTEYDASPSTTAASAYSQQILGDGPALYWPLSDPTGSASAIDLSGNRDVGTLPTSAISEQTPSPVEGAGGSGITLTGGDLVSTQPQYAPSTYSEELWFKTTSTTGGALATFAETSNNNAQDRIVYMTAGGHLDFGVYPGSAVTIQSPAAYNDGHWHFVVATQSSDGMHLYVDGQAVASGTTTTHATYLANWDLGGVANNWPGSTTSPFSGSLSDAAWFHTELTPAQVQAEYASSPAG